MSDPSTYMGQPEITGAKLKYDQVIHISFTGSPLPHPLTANTHNICLLYKTNAYHHNSLSLTPTTAHAVHPVSTGTS